MHRVHLRDSPSVSVSFTKLQLEAIRNLKPRTRMLLPPDEYNESQFTDGRES